MVMAIEHCPNTEGTHCTGCNWEWPCWGSMSEDMLNQLLTCLRADSAMLDVLLDPEVERVRVQVYEADETYEQWLTVHQRGTIREVMGGIRMVEIPMDLVQLAWVTCIDCECDTCSLIRATVPDPDAVGGDGDEQ